MQGGVKWLGRGMLLLLFIQCFTVARAAPKFYFVKGVGPTPLEPITDTLVRTEGNTDVKVCREGGGS